MITTTRILLSYAGRDANYRSLLIAATRATGLPVRFVEVPGVVTDTVGRRALCDAKLQQCDAAVVLISRHSSHDANVASDISTIQANRVELHGVMAGQGTTLPGICASWPLSSVLTWSWPRIAAFLQHLQSRELTLSATG